ncbi:hypothetical protein Taro_048166 [Colocasia esculenta]|uniref:Di19 zinc-binding domain-containing protein n=1 Tax=Colocasia esculenta TaxID=4460 RepID=A0A843X2C5_COLES|nr:hypothetical protein [Colocasia esculenta]
MEADSWNRLSASSKRQQNALQSRFDPYMGFEEVDGGEDDPRVEFPCPFCSEDFDIVGLCCHIDDEHPVEARNGPGFASSQFTARVFCLPQRVHSVLDFTVLCWASVASVV